MIIILSLYLDELNDDDDDDDDIFTCDICVLAIVIRSVRLSVLRSWPDTDSSPAENLVSLGEDNSLERGHQRGVPAKRSLYYRY